MSTHATKEGTARFRDRFLSTIPEGNFRRFGQLWVSSIGFGSYLGEHDDKTDSKYQKALVRAVELGCNHVDTAINYRFQRSERSIGSGLKTLFEDGEVCRDELVIATKGGYIPFDASPPGDMRKYLVETFVEPGIISPEDIAGGSHCMSPSYIQNQIDKSLENLSLDCVDIYYVHNPEEQLKAVPRDKFYERLRAVFELLEKKVSEGKVKSYGTATWNGYRQNPEEPDYLSLEKTASIAEGVGGEAHHFRAIQLPFNLAMPEALVKQNQSFEGQQVPALEAAERLGVTVFSSSSLLQSRLTSNLPDFIGEYLKGARTNAQRAIQFARSAPGVTCALVGMSSIEHVEENMGVAELEAASVEALKKLFRN